MDLLRHRFLDSGWISKNHIPCSTAYSPGTALRRKLQKTRVLENLQDEVLGEYKITKAIYQRSPLLIQQAEADLVTYSLELQHSEQNTQFSSGQQPYLPKVFLPHPEILSKSRRFICHVDSKMLSVLHRLQKGNIRKYSKSIFL